MLNVKPFRGTPGFCGPACLKMILEFYGVKKTERELAKLSGHTIKKGVKAENVVKAAKKIGFVGKVKDFSTIKDLKYYIYKKNIPVIVDWFSVDEGHYSIVVDIDKKNIYLQDPEIGSIRTMRISTFMKVWFDFSGDYPKGKKDLIIRRLIIIEKK